jgi:hypothetical protein
MKLTESQLRKIIRSVLMVEAATLSFDVDKIENSEYKLARFNQSPDSNEGVKQGLSNAKFVAAEGNTDPYGYYVDAGRVIKWIKAPEGEKKLTVDIVSKGDKQLKNKSFDITPENISKGGVKKLALAFASVMDTASFKGAVRAGQGKDITDEQIDSFLSFLLEGEAATDPEGESEQEPSSPEQEPGESKQEVFFYIRQARTKKGETVGQTVGTTLQTMADYQEKELVPLDNILLNPKNINNRMHVPTKPYSKYNSYIGEAITLQQLLEKAPTYNQFKTIDDVTAGYLLYKEFANSKYSDGDEQTCYKFASDVGLIVYFKPTDFISDFKLKDGAEAILYIDGPTSNNFYIKGYKLDAATGRLKQ